MIYLIYKITNRIDGKIYIGAHKTSKLDDGYMGSGKYLKSAQNKYGIENFEKEILEVFDNPETMFEMESILVNQEFVERSDTYNIKPGGEGGFDYINKNGLNNSNNNNIKANNGYKQKFTNVTGNEEWYLERKKLGSEAFRKMHQRRKTDSDFDLKFRDACSKSFKGKKHTEETKRKIGRTNSIHQTGEGNNQFGTMWIYSLTEKVSKKIKKEDFPQWEAEGWGQGRKMKFL